MLRRGTLIGAMALVLAALTAVPAFAGGAGTETSTGHEHEVTLFEATMPNPCTGELGTIQAVAKNFKIHETTQADGEKWVTGTGNGAVTFTPVELGGVSYSGHFTQWFGESINNKNKVEHATGTFALKGTDGSTVHLHMLFHVSTNAKGEPTVEKTEVTDIHCG